MLVVMDKILTLSADDVFLRGVLSVGDVASHSYSSPPFTFTTTASSMLLLLLLSVGVTALIALRTTFRCVFTEVNSAPVTDLLAGGWLDPEAEGTSLSSSE